MPLVLSLDNDTNSNLSCGHNSSAKVSADCRLLDMLCRAGDAYWVAVDLPHVKMLLCIDLKVVWTVQSAPSRPVLSGRVLQRPAKAREDL